VVVPRQGPLTGSPGSTMAGDKDGKLPSYLLDQLGAAHTPSVPNDVGAPLYVAPGRPRRRVTRGD
jgi:hypothetical protein